MTATEAIAAPAPARTAPSPRWRTAKHALAWALPLLALAGGGVFAAARWSAAHPKATVQYETALLDRGPIAAKVTATGALSALVTVQVGSQVSGRIDALFADFESPVTKGQIVATIEPSLFRAAVAQARANLVAAQASVDKARAQLDQADRAIVRARALYAEGVASKADLDLAQADFEVARATRAAAIAGVAQAKAALEQTELNLRYTTIISPIDGTVISRNVDVGQTVAAALQAPTLFTIAQDLTKMQVDTNVAEADVGKIRPGMVVTFTVDAYPQRPFAGTVRQVRDNATTLQNVVTYDAVLDVDNSERLLKPGMTASVTFTYATRGDAVRVPNVALRFKPDAAALVAMTGSRTPPTLAAAPDERGLWVLRDGRASVVKARIGITDGTWTEVTGGAVRPGDTVVTEANADAKP